MSGNIAAALFRARGRCSAAATISENDVCCNWTHKGEDLLCVTIVVVVVYSPSNHVTFCSTARRPDHNSSAPSVFSLIQQCRHCSTPSGGVCVRERNSQTGWTHQKERVHLWRQRCSGWKWLWQSQHTPHKISESPNLTVLWLSPWKRWEALIRVVPGKSVFSGRNKNPLTKKKKAENGMIFKGS